MTDTDAEHHEPPSAPPRPIVAPLPKPLYETGGWRLALLVAAGLLLLVWGGWPVLFVILGLIVMIFLHELGHFMTAKWAGMKVTEFFIGFGPRVWSFHRGETEYGIKAIPAGAYVRIIGMHNLEEVPADDESRTYRQQSFPRRLSVAVAGSAMHFLLALVLLFVALAITGSPAGTVLDGDTARGKWIVGSVLDDTPADRLGLRQGDRITSFDGRRVVTYVDLVEAIRANDPGDEVSLEVLRDGERLERSARLTQHPDFDEPVAFLGITRTYDNERVAPLTAVGRSAKELGIGIKESTSALARFFTPGGIGNFSEDVREGSEEPAPEPKPSPDPRNVEPSRDDGDRLVSIYGAVRLGSQLTETGIQGYLGFFITVNITVGIFNLIPLLPLDGGHVAIAVYERIRSRRGRRYFADVAKLMPLTYAVVMMLILLGVTTLYLDIVDPLDL